MESDPALTLLSIIGLSTIGLVIVLIILSFVFLGLQNVVEGNEKNKFVTILSESRQ